MSGKKYTCLIKKWKKKIGGKIKNEEIQNTNKNMYLWQQKIKHKVKSPLFTISLCFSVFKKYFWLIKPKVKCEKE